MLIVLLAGIVSACGGSINHQGDLGARTHVVTQICLPNDKGRSEDVVWLDPVTRSGYGGRAERITAVTASDQPVFESYAGPPTDIVGIVVFLASARDTRFIFVLPQSLSAASWSQWEGARFSTKNDRVPGFLMRGMEVPDKASPSTSAPRIRYRLMRFNEYLSGVGKRREKGIETDLPPC